MSFTYVPAIPLKEMQAKKEHYRHVKNVTLIWIGAVTLLAAAFITVMAQAVAPARYVQYYPLVVGMIASLVVTVGLVVYKCLLDNLESRWHEIEGRVMNVWVEPGGSRELLLDLSTTRRAIYLKPDDNGLQLLTLNRAHRDEVRVIATVRLDTKSRNYVGREARADKRTLTKQDAS